MSLRRYTTSRKFASLLLALLAVQMSLIIPHVEWVCRCGDDLPHTATCCCNCPKCVEKRDGLLSYCKISPIKDKERSRGQFLVSTGCSCGLRQVILNMPGDAPYLPPAKITGTFLPRMHADPPKIRDTLQDVTFSIIQPPG